MSESQTVRNQQRDLRELAYAFRSLQLFLEHIEIRFAKLLGQLEPLVPALRIQEEHRVSLENELESTCQEVSFLQREIKTLERVMARQEDARESRLQGRLHELEQAYTQLDAWLETSKERIEGLEETASSLVEQVRVQRLNHEETIAELQAENNQQTEALAAFEDTEQEYLSLLEQKERQLNELKQMYESELGTLSEELERSSHDEQSRQQQDQNLGRNLARMAQERNAVIQNQQNLSEHVEALEQENRDLREALSQAQSDQIRLKDIETSWHERFGPHLPLEVLSYCHAWETITGLGLDLPESLFHELATSLRLPEGERRLLESRLQLQPGRLQSLLSQWSESHGGVKKSPPAPTEPLQALIRIPAGSYPLGDDLHPAERPAHSYTSESYLIGRLPVTNADYSRFMAAAGYANPDYWLPEGWNFIQKEQIKSPAFWQKRGYACGPDYPDSPVIGVSWYEAIAYATWAGLRLPSEAEWEASGRGPDGLRWPWGDEWHDGLANTAEAGLNNTTPVGLFPAGASPFGALDLVGNVFEWTLSLYRPYPYRSDDGREDLRGTDARTLKGCSWNHRGHYFTRLSYRFQADPTTRHSDIGFRLAGE